MRRIDDGRPIRRGRKRRRLTQRDLAYLCRVSQTTIFLLEKPGAKGMDTCSDELAQRIADRLDVDVEDLFVPRASVRASEMATGSLAARRAS
jgi:DNA-binding XRE family transcriptional regulator